MSDNRAHVLIAAALLGAMALPATAAPVLGQADTFEDGTTEGWASGALHPVPPTTVATGGPAGTGDAYLLLQAIGGPELSGGATVPGGRLSVRNSVQWAGDYAAAGISALVMDVNNFGPSDLSLRILLEAGGTPPTDIAWSTTPALLPAGSGWRRVLFPIADGDLAAPPGDSVGAARADVSAIRLFHGTTSAFPGEPVLVTLGIDNITAVPLPAAAWSMAFAWGLLSRRRLKR